MYDSLAHFLSVEAEGGCPDCGTSPRLLRLKRECDDRCNARLRDTLKPSAEDREKRGYLQQAYDLRASCRAGHDLLVEMRDDGQTVPEEADADELHLQGRGKGLIRKMLPRQAVPDAVNG